jgi:hypothetical protein
MEGRYAVEEDGDPVYEPYTEDVEGYIFDIQRLDTCYKYRNGEFFHDCIRGLKVDVTCLIADLVLRPHPNLSSSSIVSAEFV